MFLCIYVNNNNYKGIKRIPSKYRMFYFNKPMNVAS